MHTFRWVAGQVVVAVARLADAVGAADDDVGILACAECSIWDRTRESAVVLVAVESQWMAEMGSVGVAKCLLGVAALLCGGEGRQASSSDDRGVLHLFSECGIVSLLWWMTAR